MCINRFCNRPCFDSPGQIALLPFAISPERGTSQGDVYSPVTWIALFDVLLCFLEKYPDFPGIFSLPQPGGTLYRAREVFDDAEDLRTRAGTLTGCQRMAGLVSTNALVFNRTIACKKPRVFRSCGRSLPRPSKFVARVLYNAGSHFWRILQSPLELPNLLL